MDVTPASPETLAASLQASWQTVFWILVNLSICAMAQPGGRICGFPSRYRTYLRCSPLICGADMLSILIRLQVTVICLRLSVLESVGILLHNRFDNNDHNNDERNHSSALQSEYNDDGGNGIQTLEGMTWLRWLWFLLGTLPPTIKLASMSGVGWAQTWGTMFMGSWVINELLIIFATLNQSFFTISSSGRISWPGYEQTTRSAKYQQVQRYLDRCEKGLGMTALIMHVVVVNNIFRIISGLLDDTYPLSTMDMSDRYLRPGYVSTVSVTAWIPTGLIIVVFGQRYNFFASFLLGLFFIMVGNVGANSLLFGKAVLGAGMSPSSGRVWAISTVVIPTLVLLIRSLSQRFIMIGRNLLVLYRNGTEEQLSIDYSACLSLILFLSTIVTSLFWYGKIYDSSGTSMPVWTGVFG